MDEVEPRVRELLDVWQDMTTTVVVGEQIGGLTVHDLCGVPST
ncbi:hypothetical protein [Streptomyces sp. KHY 26]